MADRRRVNGPHGGTTPIALGAVVTSSQSSLKPYPEHQELLKTRRIFLKTGLAPSASGSAYLELQCWGQPAQSYLRSQVSSLKLTCAVYGPRPLPRSSLFSPQMQVSTTVKFAPFATGKRRGYLRDSTERDLAAHLETALRAAIITEKWPKSTMDVIITVLEVDEHWLAQYRNRTNTSDPGVGENIYSMMSTLSGCITVASAAIANANIDCIDIVTGGTAALIEEPLKNPNDNNGSNKRPQYQLVTSPTLPSRSRIIALCTVGYLPSRDEITGIWLKGSIGSDSRSQDMIGILIDDAVNAATASALVVRDGLMTDENI